MLIELNESEVRELLLTHIQKLIPLDITSYDVALESVSRYSGRNPGGLEITLTRKPVPADSEPVREAA